jgi:MOSC domain-containing protein YiiM
MGKILSINVGAQKGIKKTSIEEVNVLENWGLEGDAHGGDWDRQVSIFPVEAMTKVPEHKLQEVENGDYTENFTVSGVPLDDLTVGTRVRLGEAEVDILHIGKKEFKEHGRPYIVSREGRFGRVIKGGRVKAGDEIKIISGDKQTSLQ